MKKKRMALILPGLGYHSDKPLLYYAKKLFRQRGYQIEEITYQNLPEWNKENLEAVGEIVTQQAEKAFAQIDTQSYEEIVFISKHWISCCMQTDPEVEERVETYLLYTGGGHDPAAGIRENHCVFRNQRSIYRLF